MDRRHRPVPIRPRSLTLLPAVSRWRRESTPRHGPVQTPIDCWGTFFHFTLFFLPPLHELLGLRFSPLGQEVLYAFFGRATRLVALKADTRSVNAKVPWVESRRNGETDRLKVWTHRAGVPRKDRLPMRHQDDVIKELPDGAARLVDCHNYRPALCCQTLQGTHHALCLKSVETCCWFVCKDQRRRREDLSGEGESLLLSTRNPTPSLVSHNCVGTFRKTQSEKETLHEFELLLQWSSPREPEPCSHCEGLPDGQLGEEQIVLRDKRLFPQSARR
mmetsp:Transcript_24732/g.48508  ORF Transcript_24732/g.48508 Transcript_24732/m.48508 type:complete len:275 (-) Transcript_24732:553-1377(-)